MEQVFYCPANYRYNSYQHFQGIMLVRLNFLAYELNLSHSEYRIMGTLISLWNMKQGMAYPTIEYLAKNCRMGKQTVIKALNNLVHHRLLVVVKNSSERNNYYFTNLLIDNVQTNPVETSNRITCKTDHEIKQNKNITTKHNCSFKNENGPFKQTLEQKRILSIPFCIKTLKKRNKRYYKTFFLKNKFYKKLE